MTSLLALDVGGANLKAADGRGYAASRPFALWRQPAKLAAALAAMIASAPRAERIVATMTGELADCFTTKSEGVRAIVAALEHAAAGLPLQIYLTDGRLVPPAEAVERPLAAAASNWHAMARFVARWLPSGSGGMIDVGSTTTDIIAILQNMPVAAGLTDPNRLATRELVYTGVVRSPVCAMVRELPWGNATCGVAQELFATTLDVWLMLGEMPELASGDQTADGRPATRACARDRLARMVCADRDLFDEQDAMQAARHIAEAQTALVVAGVRRSLPRVLRDSLPIVVCGQGEFLARRALAQIAWRGEIISARERLSPAMSAAGPAHALAVLAQEALAESSGG